MKSVYPIDLLTLVNVALQEDMPQGDLTTDSIEKLIQAEGEAYVIAKQELILSGTKPFSCVFETVDPKIQIHWLHRDGEKISSDTKICELKGSLAQLLKAERTGMNFLGHLSGIATLTSKYVAKTKGTKTKILDTRKTTPGLRSLEKQAVRDGGGHNHRSNLSEGVLIKENHIRFAGSINRAVDAVRKNSKLAIEVEVRNRSEILEALDCKVEKVLLDNMNVSAIAESVKLIDGKCQIEVSGNVTLDNVSQIANLGVDFISVGRITHSAPNADLSMLFQGEQNK